MRTSVVCSRIIITQGRGRTRRGNNGRDGVGSRGKKRLQLRLRAIHSLVYPIQNPIIQFNTSISRRDFSHSYPILSTIIIVFISLI